MRSQFLLSTYVTIPSMDFSPITDDLIIGTTPSINDYNALRELGVNLVINMRMESRSITDAHNPPMPMLWLPTLDIPLIQLPVKLLHRGVLAALETIRKGGKIYSHCAYGAHRSVAMGACILIAQGHSPMDAMQLIKARRAKADPHAFHIRTCVLKFAKQWNLKLK